MIWDYLFGHPKEFAIVIGAVILGYVLWIELSKFIWKALYITKKGEWRVYRYVGRIMKIPDKAEFVGEKTLDSKKFRCIVKLQGKPRRELLLDRNDILYKDPRKIVMNKKHIYWDIKEGAYRLTDNRIKSYKLKPKNYEMYALHLIDEIDLKSTRSARASPQVVHQQMAYQHLPLDAGTYTETEERDMQKHGNYVFDYENVGSYGYYDDKEEDEDDIDKDTDKILENLHGRRRRDRPRIGG